MQSVIKAEQAGMSSERLTRVERLSERYIQDNRFAGMVTLLARQGKLVLLQAKGTLGLEDHRPMETDSLFRIYSMTKPITAIAAMMLYEEGAFRLDEPVHRHIEELRGLKVWTPRGLVATERAVTVRQLFTQTAGFTYGFTQDNPIDAAYVDHQLLDSASSTEFVTKLAQQPLRFQPGTRYHYSVATDVLGVLIERISGQSLSDFFSARIFEPLGMSNTFFNVPETQLTRLVGDHFFDYQHKQARTVPLQKQRNFINNGFESGGGGLVSSAYDYYRFAQMVLNGGELEGQRLLSPKTVRYLSLDHLSASVRAEGANDYPDYALLKGQSMGLGFGVVTQPARMPAISSEGELSWSGAAGTQFWIDPQEQLIAVCLVQLYQSPWPLLSDLKACVYQALID